MPLSQEERIRRARISSDKASRKWHAAHPEYERERSKRRYRTDSRYRERVREAAKKHAKEHPTYYAVAAHRRRVLVRDAGTFTVEDWRRVRVAYGRVCVYCGRRGRLTIDHVVALSKGGTNSILNVVPACKRCNSSKHDRSVIEFVERRGVTEAFRQRRLSGMKLLEVQGCR